MIRFYDFFKNKNIIVIIFFIAMFFRTLYLLYGCVLCADDIYWFYFEDGIKFLQSRNGDWPTYLSNILNFWLPFKLNINIQDYNGIVCNIFKSAISTTVFVFLYKFLADAKINKYVSILFISILYCLFFIFEQRLSFVDFIINEGCYRFIFTTCLYVIFLYYSFKIYNKEHKYSFPKLTLLAVLVAASSEFMLFLLVLTTPIIFFINKEKRKKYYFIIFGIVFGGLLLILQGAFWENIVYKLSRTDNSFSIMQIITYLPEYTKMAIDKVFIGHLPIFIFIAICTLINLVNKADVFAQKYFKYMCSLFVVSMVFVYSFVFLGKSSYSHDFWLDHNDLYTILVIIYFTLSVLCVCSLSNLLSKIGNKKIASILIIILCIVFTYYNNTCNALKNGAINGRKCIYLTDKMNLFYLYKNIPAKLPPFSKFCSSLYYLQEDSDVINDEIFIEDAESPTDIEMYKENKNIFYYPIVYKISNYSDDKDLIFTETTKEALDYFIENGGNFEEVYNGNFRFSDLENKDFVLGKHQ